MEPNEGENFGGQTDEYPPLSENDGAAGGDELPEGFEETGDDPEDEEDEEPARQAEPEPVENTGPRPWPLGRYDRFTVNRNTTDPNVRYINEALGVEGDEFTQETSYAVARFLRRQGVRPVGYVSESVWRRIFSRRR